MGWKRVLVQHIQRRHRIGCRWNESPPLMKSCKTVRRQLFSLFFRCFAAPRARTNKNLPPPPRPVSRLGRWGGRETNSKGVGGAACPIFSWSPEGLPYSVLYAENRATHFPFHRVRWRVQSHIISQNHMWVEMWVDVVSTCGYPND